MNFDVDEATRRNHYNTLYEVLCSNKNLKIYAHPSISGSAFVFPVQLLNDIDVNKAWEILSSQGVETRTLMGGVTNEQLAYKWIADGKVFENAHKMAEKTFFVGIHQTLTQNQINDVANIICQIGYQG